MIKNGIVHYLTKKSDLLSLACTLDWGTLCYFCVCMKSVIQIKHDWFNRRLNVQTDGCLHICKHRSNQKHIADWANEFWTDVKGLFTLRAITVKKTKTVTLFRCSRIHNKIFFIQHWFLWGNEDYFTDLFLFYSPQKQIKAGFGFINSWKGLLFNSILKPSVISCTVVCIPADFT